MINPKENFSGVEGTPTFFTIEDFEQKVISGDISHSDGVGYYANEHKISSVKIVMSEIIYDHINPPLPDEGRGRSRMMNGTHVAWYSK